LDAPVLLFSKQQFCTKIGNLNLQTITSLIIIRNLCIRFLANSIHIEAFPGFSHNWCFAHFYNDLFEIQGVHFIFASAVDFLRFTGSIPDTGSL
jgi:hypothetical protein